MALTIDRRGFVTTSATLAGSFFLAGLSPLGRIINADEIRNKTSVYELTEAITDANKINDSSVLAYYKVNTKSTFQIFRYNDGVYGPAYYDEDYKRGLLFPKEQSSKPVAIIDGGKAGIPGVFEVYYGGDDSRNRFHRNCPSYKSGAYCIHYRKDIQSAFISPIINVPAHTEVHPDYLLHVNNVVRSIPIKFTDAMIRRGVEIYLAKNIEDSYYHLNQRWKKYDDENPNDPKKPWLEVKEDGSCIDHRNYSNTSALYWKKKAVIPQQHYEYGTREVSDRISYPTWTKHTVGHELGHAIGAINSDDYYDFSDKEKYKSSKISSVEEYDNTDAFKLAFELDKERMPPEVKKELEYSWCKRKTLGGHIEAFANIFSALVGTETRKDAAVLLRGFPNSAEYLRKTVFPDFGVDMSIAHIRENIYPDYLKNVKLSKSERENDAKVLTRIIDNSDKHPERVFAEGIRKEVPCCGRE